MKKRKKHKWKYQVNVKKKILVLAILGVSLFVGMGYALIQSEFTLGGTIEFKKLDDTLYDAIKKETATNYAVKYTGSHQDSMDSTKSTEDIYHYYASTAARGNDILDKNNVVFANTCWQMIRTTDTGGVRIIYNGEPEEIEVNGETRLNCGDTRNLYHIGGIQTTYNLNGTAIYAKNYTATTSGSTTTFTLIDDPDDPDDYKSITVDSSNATSQIADIVENYPYVCSGGTTTCTNNNLYKIESYYSGTTVYAYRSTYRDDIGTSRYNSYVNSPTYLGYMYGDVYTQNTLNPTATTAHASSSSGTTLSTKTFDSTYKYSKTLNPTGTSGIYELDNPILGSDIPNQDYSGYYTYGSSTTTSGGSPYYIVANSTGSTYYYVRLGYTPTRTNFNVIVLGDTVVDNGDNTYIIKNGQNPATEVSADDWYNNYESYVGKYTCGFNANDTCETPGYVTSASLTSIGYISAKNITISTERNGLQLSGNVVTVDIGQWCNGFNTTYADYVYTCGNTDTVCTESNLKYIISRLKNQYTYITNHYFGQSVIYEDNKYKLQNIVPLENAKNTSVLKSHHYMCVDVGKTECDSVAYIYYYSGNNSMYYVLLNNPNIKSASDVLDAMFKKNTNNSVAKANVDAWYESHLLNTTFESKIDDTIYCNERSYSSLTNYTYNDSGWNDNGTSISGALYFKSFADNESDLSCPNITDRFSTSNNVAQLTYKIGLVTASELRMLGNNNARKSTNSIWTMSPSNVDYSLIPWNNQKSGSGSISGTTVTGDSFSLRPVISLIKGTKYSQGDGSMTNPYIVDMSN